MIDTLRTDFPSDMMRTAENPSLGTLEAMASGLADQVKDYAHEHPISFGLWALGIGFVLGWKLKPW